MGGLYHVTFPFLATFQRWPISKRRALFLRWLRTQRPSRPILYYDMDHCPLARFGNAIMRSRKAVGGYYSFYRFSEEYGGATTDDTEVLAPRDSTVFNAQGHTYGYLVERMSAAS